jgi:MoxR-like ATPase
MQRNEFQTRKTPIRRRGFTSIEAAQFLRAELPDVPHWTGWWVEPMPYVLSLATMITATDGDAGRVGPWTWTRVPVSYPVVSYWQSELSDRRSEDGWVGMLRIEGPSGESFLLFSCLGSNGQVGDKYYASTKDHALLDRFARDVHEALTSKRDTIRIQVVNGDDIYLPKDDEAVVFLQDSVQEDIFVQAFSFFGQKELYRGLGIPHRRGLLFVGPPGNGKTMMVRLLVRLCHRKFEADFWTLNIHEFTDADDLDRLFKAAARKGRGIVILEDLDSLLKETKITRAGLLSRLDGLEPKDGLLIVATTNNPREIDPALVHRPSRFDRVWHFRLPDQDLRERYLSWSFGHLRKDFFRKMAKATEGWSFAYLNELRITSAVMAIQESEAEVTDAIVQEGHRILDAQFRAGSKNHGTDETGSPVGFAA